MLKHFDRATGVLGAASRRRGADSGYFNGLPAAVRTVWRARLITSMVARPMRLLFVTPELTPYSGSTPIGDACGALPKALRGRGHEVTVLSPLYGFIDPVDSSLARRLRKVEVELGSGSSAFTVFDARTAAGVDLLFLGHEELFGDLEDVPLDDADPAVGKCFGAFAKAALEVIRSDADGYDGVICVDWQTALVPLLAKHEGLDVATVLLVSDVRRQGRFERDLMGELGLDDSLFSIDGLEFYGKLCFLKGGVQAADRVTTVSPSYATEVVQYADGLEGAFKARGKEFLGIVGGVDTALWNPATDAHLESRFDPMDLSGKKRCKAAFQQEAGFPVRDDLPLIVALGTITADSGLDVLARIGGRVLRNDVQIAIIAEGDEVDDDLLDVLGEHAERWPDRVYLADDPDTGAVHRALSAADLVLVEPSQDPGGATQLRAHRYGALPIGLRAGALADTVVDCDAKLSTGTGFTYDEASDDVILATVQRGVASFAKRSAFEKVRQQAMRSDQGWERSAYLYERLLSSLAG